MKKSIGAQTIVYPTPVFVVATYDASGRANAMAVAWGGISCSNPPCVSISLRKATYTYDNLVLCKAFTLNIPSQSQVKEADYFGMVSGRTEDKFAVTGFTAVRSELVDAPLIEEMPFCVECKLFKTVELGLHTVFVGEILDIKVDPAMCDAKGVPDITKIRPFLYDPAARRYYGIGASLAEAFSVGKSLKGKK